MKLPTWGLLIAVLAALTGCLAPMTQREAQGYAQKSLRGYCSGTAPCRFVKAQKMGPGWLLDYESNAAKYGVLVHDNGGTAVSVWSKDANLTR